MRSLVKGPVITRKTLGTKVGHTTRRYSKVSNHDVTLGRMGLGERLRVTVTPMESFRRDRVVDRVSGRDEVRRVSATL